MCLTVKNGDRQFIVGNIGSGKTTFINFLLGEKQPDSGEVRICRQIGYCSSDNFSYEGLTVLDHLRVMAKIKGIENRELVIQEAIESFKLQKFCH